MQPLTDIFNTLYQSQQASQKSLDQVGRVNYPVLCVVSDNNDPENKRRIKVSDPAKPGLNSDWLRRIQPHPFFDPPLPPVGSTVICFFENGSEVNGWYLQCVNATNPPFEKESPQNDRWEETPGHKTAKVGGNHLEEIKGDATETIDGSMTLNIKTNETNQVNGTSTTQVDMNYLMNSDATLTISNTAGASVTLLTSGAVVISSSSGASLTLGGGSGGTAQGISWDLGGHALNITNTSSVSIKGKQIATIDAVDNAGEILVTKGWT